MSENLDGLITGDVASWIEGLPKYQRSHIAALLEARTPIEVAEIWLGNSRPRDTAPYGGARVVAARFYDNLLVQLEKLFCGAPEYEADRKKLGQAAGASKLLIVGAVSTAIAPYVGAAAAVLGPAIAVTLGVVGTAGQATVCDTLNAMIQERQEADQAGDEALG